MLSLGLNIWQPAIRQRPPNTVITANRALHLAKGAASGVTWTDSSGNARNLTLTGSPTIGATSVTFSGTGQYGTAAFTIGTPCSIYMRVKQVSWAAGRYLYAGATAATNHLQQVTGTPQIEANDAVLTHVGGGLSGATVGSFVSVGAVFTGAAGGVLNVGGSELTLDNATGNAVAAGFTLAAGSSAGVSPSNIEVVEVVLYSVAHDVTQRAQMIAYLNTL